MYNKKMFKETFAAINASEDTLTEGLNMTTRKNAKNQKLRHKRIIGVLVTVIAVTALSITALAYSGLMGWILPDRDAETKQMSESAQDALSNFAGLTTPSDESRDVGIAIDEERDREDIAVDAANRFSGQVTVAWPEITLSDYAMEYEDGAVLFYFSPGENTSLKGSISVQVSKEGAVTGIDLRQAIPYPQPEDCPEEYTGRAIDMDGNEIDVFYADYYLPTVTYPDRSVYAPKAEAAAAEAMAQLYENGFIAADPSTVDIIYFENFNGGAAWVDVLMENGDVYCLFLQPDGFSILGFDLRTTEQLAAGNGNADLYEALRNGTLEEYQKQQQELYATSVG